ncbi:MAG: hypothetical protein V9G12_13245 [Microthrixaceae bacterium]
MIVASAIDTMTVCRSAGKIRNDKEVIDNDTVSDAPVTMTIVQRAPRARA